VNRNICSEFVAVTWQRCRGNMHGACVAAQGWVGCVRLSVWLQVGSLLLAIVALQCSASAWGAEQSVSIVKRYKLVACTPCGDYRCLPYLRILIHLVVGYRSTPHLPMPQLQLQAGVPRAALRGSCRALPCARVRDRSRVGDRCWVRAPRHMYRP
jgi:hypothetical protein